MGGRDAGDAGDGRHAMRFGPDDKFWVVTDPTPESRMEDAVKSATEAISYQVNAN